MLRRPYPATKPSDAHRRAGGPTQPRSDVERPAGRPSRGASPQPALCSRTWRGTVRHAQPAPGLDTRAASRAHGCSGQRSQGRAQRRTGPAHLRRNGRRPCPLRRMAEDDVSVIEAARLRLDCLDEDAGRRVNVVACSFHASESPRARVVEKRPPPPGKRAFSRLTTSSLTRQPRGPEHGSPG